MLLDYYDQFKKYFLMNNIMAYGQKSNMFIGGDEESVKRVMDFKTLEKGCEIWVEGGKYPIRAHASEQKVAIIGQTKRLIPLLTKNNRRKILLLLNLDCVIDWLHYYLSNAYLEENQYSQPVRELYRIIKNSKIRDILCVLCEYDTAYRFRLQDVLVHLDKEKSVTWNLKMMLDMLIEREVTPAMKSKWQRLRSIIWLIPCNRKMMRELKQIFTDLNIDEIKSSVEDYYWQCGYKDYNFKGLLYETRQMVKETL